MRATHQERVREILRRKRTRPSDWPMAMSSAPDALNADTPVSYDLTADGLLAIAVPDEP